MAQAPARPTAVDVLRSASSGVADGFQAMRDAVATAGPIDAKHRELIMLAGFVTASIESGFKTHCGRAFAQGATIEEVHQAVLLTLGSTAGISQVGAAFRWADEVAKGA